MEIWEFDMVEAVEYGLRVHMTDFVPPLRVSHAPVRWWLWPTHSPEQRRRWDPYTRIPPGVDAVMAELIIEYEG